MRLSPVAGGSFQLSGRSGTRFGHTPEEDRRAHLRLEATIERTFGPNSSPQTAAAFAILMLQRNRPSLAIAILQDSLKRLPSDARLLNDLAVAHAIRAGSDDDLGADWILALDYSLQASALAPLAYEPPVNRSLVLANLGIITPNFQCVTDSLSCYFSTNTNQAQPHLPNRAKANQWKSAQITVFDTQAPSNLRQVDSVAREFPTQTRQLVENILLPDWASSLLRPPVPEHAHREELLRHLVRRFAQDNGDPLLLESFNLIARATGGPKRDLETLVEGHLLYQRAITAYDTTFSLDQACPTFENAHVRLRAASSPFAHWTQFYRGVCYYWDADYTKATALLEPLRQEAAETRHLGVASRASWVLGLVAVRTGRTADALYWYNESLNGFRHLHEPENVAYLHFLLAEALESLGTPEEAWKLRLQALRGLSHVADSRRAHNILIEASDAALRQSLANAALLLNDLLLELEIVQSRPNFEAEARLRRAHILQALGRTPQADEELSQAEHAVKTISTPALHDRLLADILLSRGKLLAGTQPRSALRYLDRALGFYLASDYRFRLPELHLLHASISTSLGMTDVAYADLRAGLSAFENERTKIIDPTLRGAYFQQARSIVEWLVEIDVDRSDHFEAFLTQESARARALSDEIGRVTHTHRVVGGQDTADLRRLRETLPRGIAIVEYFVGAEVLHTWVITRGHLTYFSTRVSSPYLEHVSSSFAECMQSSPISDCHQFAEELYDLIVRPLEGSLADAHLVVIVPDRFLHRLSFSALRDRVAGEFSAEKPWSLTYAPSARLLMESDLLRDPQPDHAPRSLLLVANPLIDRSIYPHLAPLPSAAREWELLNPIYPRIRMLVGREATKRSFLDLAGSYEVISFAGHVLGNQGTPSAAHLVLAPGPEPGESSQLTVQEIAEHRFASTRLVVLSGCSSTGSQVLELDGVIGLANAFLSAGVQAVLATNAPIADEATSMFILDFHRVLQTGAGAATALRSAQRSAIERHSSDSRVVWPAFQLIGTFKDLPSNNRRIHNDQQQVRLSRRSGAPFTNSPGMPSTPPEPFY